MSSDHNHHNHHDHHHNHHHHSSDNYNQAFTIGLILNILIVAIQIIFGFVSNSLSLLADAGHNLGDVLGLIIAWTASWLVKRQASARYTYGFRRSSILAALLNASLIMIALGAIAVEAIHRFQNPQPLQENIVIVIASLGIILNGFTAWLFSKDQQDLNLKGVFLHMVTDALVSLGVVLSAITILVTGWTWLDPVMSLVISVLIFLGTWRLLKDSVALLLDGVPVNIETQAIQTYLQELPNVIAIHDLHIWAMSTTENALTVHIIVKNPTPDDHFLQTLQQEIREYFGINHTTIQLESGQNLLICRTQNCYHPN